MLDSVTSLVGQRWRFASATAFGSYPAQLSTFLSDVDIYLTFDKKNVSTTEKDDLDSQEVEEDETNDVPSGEVTEVFDEETDMWCIDLTGIPSNAPVSSSSSDVYIASDSESDASESSSSNDPGDSDMHFNVMNAAVDTTGGSKRLSWSATIDTIENESDASSTAVPRHQQLNYLRELRSRLKWLPWVASLELRSRARVPIINIQHSSGCVECDIGVIEENTSELVLELSSGRMLSDMSEDFYCKYSLLFRTLTMFLKVFLWNFGLDKPFTGGLGSFKVYVMVAHILTHAPHDAVMAGDAGFLLIVFLKFFGSEKHLNKKSVVRAGSAEVSFESTHLVEQCRKTFHVAHLAVTARMQLLSEKPHHGKITSFIALIINTPKVQRYRQASLRQCARYGNEKPADDTLAELVLAEVQQAHQLPIIPTVADVKRFDPVLGSVLSALQSRQDAMYLVYGSRNGTGREIDARNDTKSFKRAYPEASLDYSQHAKRWSRHDKAYAKKKKPYVNWREKQKQKVSHKKIEQQRQKTFK